MLASTNIGQTTFSQNWADQVAAAFSLDQQSLRNIYTDSDTSDSNWNTRVAWKDATARTVTGTPVAYVNGAQLAVYPADTDAWLVVLNATKAKQYPLTTETTCTQ